MSEVEDETPCSSREDELLAEFSFSPEQGVKELQHVATAMLKEAVDVRADDHARRRRLSIACLELAVELMRRDEDGCEFGIPSLSSSAIDASGALLGPDVSLSTEDVTELLSRHAAITTITQDPPGDWFLDLLEQRAEREPLTMEQCELVDSIRSKMMSYEKSVVRRLSGLMPSNAGCFLAPGEAWTDAAMAMLSSRSSAERPAWHALLEHCRTANGGAPTKKWLRAAGELLESVGNESFQTAAEEWMVQFGLPPTDPTRSEYLVHGLPIPQNANYMKGVVWCSSLFTGDNTSLARSLASLVLAALKKVPGHGPRSILVSNAAVWVLGRLDGLEGVGQLGYLASRVRGANAKKSIAKAFAVAGERLGLTPDELIELAAPTYGLTEVGRGEVALGEFTALVQVTGTASTEMRWRKPDGKVQKSIPKPVREGHGDGLKALRASVKDLGKMLPAQRDRIDSMFLDRREWAATTWRERYLDHPLVGTIARRVIWTFERDGVTRAAIHHDGALRVLDGSSLPESFEVESAVVRLWHPVTVDREEVLAWRAFLEAREITQPFKQAHREVYLLTDAERATNTYSNRFAAHVLKQHQFNALCDARNWKNTLRLEVDDSYGPAHRLLPQWGLRAEYWIEGIQSTDETHWGGVYPLVATDQVRFYPIEAPLPLAHATGGGYGFSADEAPDSHALESIPPLVLSEVMRDVDLFVGVASVGADPNWADGGREVPHHDYWTSYAFGDLSASAKTRKEILERLVPKLDIASRCSFDEKSLVVRGDRRSYRIHLGSGNILMEPNDQYLCIVTDPKSPRGDQLYLPFEGDRVLSLILSKAIMLADDTSITDPTILSQIGGG